MLATPRTAEDKITIKYGTTDIGLDVQYIKADQNLILPSGRVLRSDRVAHSLGEDFVGPSGTTLPAWLLLASTGSDESAGYVDDAACGVYALTHGSTSGAQTFRLDSGDHLWVNMSKSPYLEARLKLNTAGATMSADQRFVVGFASNYNATLDSVATNCWFRVEGANWNILVESDDATTDDDDNDTGTDAADNTYVVLAIDASNLSAVKFYVDGVLQSTTLSMADLSADTLVQPLIALQRDAGAEQEVMSIDYIYVSQLR